MTPLEAATLAIYKTDGCNIISADHARNVAVAVIAAVAENVDNRMAMAMLNTDFHGQLSPAQWEVILEQQKVKIAAALICAIVENEGKEVI